MTKLSEIITAHETLNNEENILPSIKESVGTKLAVLKEVEQTYGEMATFDEEFGRFDDEEMPDELDEPDYCPCCKSELTEVQVFYKNTSVKAMFFMNHELLNDEYTTISEQYSDKLIVMQCNFCSYMGLELNQKDVTTGKLLANVITSLTEMRVKRDEM